MITTGHICQAMQPPARAWFIWGKAGPLADLPYMKWYPGDFYRDTADLTPMAELAYRRLLEFMWSRGGWLDLNHPSLARIARCDPKNWSRVWIQLEPLLIIEDGRISQNRILEDRAKAGSVSGARRRSGAAGGRAKASNIKASCLANAKQNPSIPIPEPDTTKLDIESSLVLGGASPMNGAAHSPKKKGTRLPEDWQPADHEIQFAFREGLTRDEAQREYEKFCDYWDGKSGQQATKLDWNATFRNWLRRASDDKKNRLLRQQGQFSNKRH